MYNGMNGHDEERIMPGPLQMYCLRWNNHRSNLLIVFEHLFQTESFTDVTLACEGTSIKCHKMVLAACSSYFESLFMDNDCPHPIVIMNGIKFSEIKGILEYMYRGEVNVGRDELVGLLKAADTLMVKGLVEDHQHLAQAHANSRSRSQSNSNSHSNSHSPLTPDDSINQIQVPVIPAPVIPDVQPSTSGYNHRRNSFSANNFATSDPLYEPPYNQERTNSFPNPIWPGHKLAPSPSPKHNHGYENMQTEPVPMRKKRSATSTSNKDTPFLRNALGHSSNQHNATDPSPPPQTIIPMHHKYNLIVNNNSNGPIDQNDRMHGESPDQYNMDDSIRSVESDRGHDDNLSYNNGPEDMKIVGPNNLAGYVPPQKPEWKRYKQYTRADIMAAIEAVKQGMSALQAARKFSVPSRTLYDKVKKMGIATNRPYKKGSFSMSPFQGVIKGEGESYSPEDQSADLPGNGNGTGFLSADLPGNGNGTGFLSADLPGNGNGTGFLSGNGSETDPEKMDSEGSDVKHNVTTPPLNDDKDDSNHIIIDENQGSSKQFMPE